MILHLRQQSQLTISQVAAYLGVTIAYYRQIEDGIVKPSSSVLSKLAALYTGPSATNRSQQRLIININSGPGSNSNSGYIHNYVNEAGYAAIERRLNEMEKVLQSVLLQLASLKKEGCNCDSA